MLAVRGGADAFVAKFSPTGAHVWSKSFGGLYGDQAVSICADPSGNVLVLGAFTGSIDFGGGPLLDSGGGDAFLVKLSSGGSHIWSKAFSAPGSYDWPNAVAADANGNVVITGNFRSTIDLGGGLLNAVTTGIQNFYVAKYSSSGGHQWSERFGGTAGMDGLGIVADATGHVIVTGYFQGTGNFGGQLLSCAGSTDIYLIRLDP